MSVLRKAISAVTLTAILGVPAVAEARGGKRVGGAIAGALAYMVGKALGKQGTELKAEDYGTYIRAHRPEADAIFDRDIAEMNKTLPRPLSQQQELKLVRVARAGDKLQLVMRFDIQRKTPTPQVLAAVKAEEVTRLCADPPTRGALSGGYSIEHWYYNPDNKTVLGSIQISIADCGPRHE